MSDTGLDYIYPSLQDAERLNQIMWNTYVWDEVNQSYKFPYGTGTTTYYNLESFPWVVDPLVQQAINDSQISQNDRDFIALVLSAKKNWSDALAAGWLVS